jgi:hypothetical protein
MRGKPAVPARQQPAHQTDLLLDEIIIVEQPGLCRRDPLSCPGCDCHDVIGRQQHARIVRQPWQQPVRPPARIDPMLTSQHYRVTLQLLDAEQLRAQQLGIPVVTQRLARARRNAKLFDDYDILLALARGAWCRSGLMACVCLTTYAMGFLPMEQQAFDRNDLTLLWCY